MGELLGRLVTGLLWGAGAGATVVFAREGGMGLRTAAKTVIKGYVIAAQKASEARDTLDDLYTEAKGGASSTAPAQPQRVPVERDEKEAPARKTVSPIAGKNGRTKATRARPRA